MEMSESAVKALDELMLAFRASVKRIAGEIAEGRGAEKIHPTDIVASKNAFLEELTKHR